MAEVASSEPVAAASNGHAAQAAGAGAASASASSSAGAAAAAAAAAAVTTNPLARKLQKVIKGHEALLRAPLAAGPTAGSTALAGGADGTASGSSGQDVVLALRGLAGLLDDNTKHSRQRLRGDIEKQSLHINQEFVAAFKPVQQALQSVVAEMESMARSCADMTQRLAAAKQETADLIRKTTALQSQQQQMELRSAVLMQFLAQYQLTPAEEAVLNGQAPFGESFFAALLRLQQIHYDCRRLLGTKHQKAGLDIMESMAALQETAYERLYRWTQAACRALTSETVDHSKLLSMAMSALRARPVLFQYSLSEFATARRTAVVRAFIDALTHGGPGGTPKPIELHAHDALRYISDMLAWLHQCLASERELLCQLLSVNLTGDDSSATTPLSTAGARNAPHHPLVFSEEDAPRAVETLDSIMEGACRPLKVRAEAVLTSERGIIVCFQVANVIHFYASMSTEILGTNSGLVQTLQGLRIKAMKVFFDALNVTANELLANVELPPADLQPPASLESSLETLRAVLASQNSAYASPEERTQQYETILSTVLEPLLQMCSLSASNLGAADMAAFMINCLYRIQNVLTLFEFTDARIEMLDAQVDQHVKTLVQAQAHHYAVRSGLEPLLRHLQEWQQTAEADRPALSAVDGMSGDMIRRNVVAFDRWLADANFGLLPQCEFLLSTRLRESVQAKATQTFLEKYSELYAACSDAANGYGTQSLLARSPEQVEKLMQ